MSSVEVTPMRAAIAFLAGDLRWAMTFLALFVFLAVRFALRIRKRPARGSLADALLSFQASIAGMAALVVAIMFTFQTPVLSTFGVPRDASDVSDPQRLLHLMQMYNRELVSASDAVQGMALCGMLVLATGANLASHVVEVHQASGTTALGAKDSTG